MCAPTGGCWIHTGWTCPIQYPATIRPKNEKPFYVSPSISLKKDPPHTQLQISCKHTDRKTLTFDPRIITFERLFRRVHITLLGSNPVFIKQTLHKRASSFKNIAVCLYSACIARHCLSYKWEWYLGKCPRISQYVDKNYHRIQSLTRLNVITGHYTYLLTNGCIHRTRTVLQICTFHIRSYFETGDGRGPRRVGGAW